MVLSDSVKAVLSLFLIRVKPGGGPLLTAECGGSISVKISENSPGKETLRGRSRGEGCG